MHWRLRRVQLLSSKVSGLGSHESPTWGFRDSLPAASPVYGQSGKLRFYFLSSAHLLPFPGILHGPHAAEYHGEPGPSDCMRRSHLSGVFNLSPEE